MKTREKLFLVVTTFFIAYLTIPIFMYISGVNISVVSIFTFASLLLLYPQAFFNKVSYSGLFYLFVLFAYYLCGHRLPGMGAGENSDLVRLVMAIAFIVPNLTIIFVLKYLNSSQIYRYVCFSSLILIIISFISFTPLIIGDNGALRQITSAGAWVYIDPRLPHYSLLHAYIMLFPSTLLAFKLKDGKLKLFFLFASLYIFYVIIKSAIAAVIVISLFVVIFMLTYNPKSEGKSLIRMAAIMLVGFLLIGSGILTYLMDSVVGFYENTASEVKMMYFKDLIEGNQVQAGNSMDIRENLHRISINSFIENPLMGGELEGGHSSLLDRLGSLGLLGFIPYVVFLCSSFMFVFRMFRNKMYKITFGIVAFCAFMLLYQKGLFGQECWLFYIVLSPAVLKYLEYDAAKRYENK